MKTPLDQKILHVAGLVIWRTRSKVGLTHWQSISCVDALFAGCLILMLLLSQQYLLLFLGVAPVFQTLLRARRREFLWQEEAATLLNQPMKNLRQEWAPACWTRYITCVFFAGMLARSLWEFGWDWIPICAFAVGITRAFAEAADVYPSSGKTVRNRRNIFLATKTAEGIS